MASKITGLCFRDSLKSDLFEPALHFQSWQIADAVLTPLRCWNAPATPLLLGDPISAIDLIGAFTPHHQGWDKAEIRGIDLEHGHRQSFNSKLHDKFLNGEILHSMRETSVLTEAKRVQHSTVLHSGLPANHISALGRINTGCGEIGFKRGDGERQILS